MQMPAYATYCIAVWDCEAQRWEIRSEGVTPRGLREEIRRLRSDGWTSVSVLIEGED
jgi:hypothetical protein